MNKLNSPLVYLDHSVLDIMLKKDNYFHGVNQIILKLNAIPVYSSENLKEIFKSVGYENKFLEILKKINARYLELCLDNDWSLTGEAELKEVSPDLAYQEFIAANQLIPNSEKDIFDLMIKFYGGNEELAFSEIFSALDHLGSEMITQLHDDFNTLKTDNQLNKDETNKIEEKLKKLSDKKNSNFSNSDMLSKMDFNNENFESMTGIGPRVLNNIEPPNVVIKIWEIVHKALIQRKINTELDLETFFGIKALPFDPLQGKDKTIIEKVNAIYGQLNYLGYYRDKGVKNKQQRMIASFSDMTHAGIASLCHVFFCRDKNMKMKTDAAYKHLNINTYIQLLK